MANNCNTCFYALMDKDLEAPCVVCTGYSNYVKGTVYMTPSHASKPLKEAIDEWVNSTNGVAPEDFWVSHKGAVPDLKYDVVHSPKHYMLFEEEGIEVRDVIEKLVKRMCELAPGDDRVPMTPMFGADYVQMMQYGMRFMDKNGKEDLLKMRWYLNKLIEAYDAPVF